VHGGNGDEFRARLRVRNGFGTDGARRDDSLTPLRFCAGALVETEDTATETATD
jgi:hypothetical protein